MGYELFIFIGYYFSLWTQLQEHQPKRKVISEVQNCLNYLFIRKVCSDTLCQINSGKVNWVSFDYKLKSCTVDHVANVVCRIYFNF